jgi:MYXO-CTERM domain-containing protein
MIGPLLRVAATAASARALRVATHDAALRVVMTLGAAIAVAGGVFCLSCAAFVLLERQLDAASAWAIIGAIWGLAGLLYFAAARRRR